jgi:hypothetical protein
MKEKCDENVSLRFDDSSLLPVTEKKAQKTVRIICMDRPLLLCAYIS